MVPPAFRKPSARPALVIAALAALLLTACSMVRVGYTQLDTFAAWKANEYFDLDWRQRDLFLARFNRLHDWHRYEQLPDYAAFLEETRRRLLRGLTREDVLWVIDGVKGRYGTIVQRGADDAAALLVTLSPGQVYALQRQLERDNASFVRENAIGEAADERRRARVRRSVDRIRDWTGTLTREQEARITAMIAAMPEIARLRHEDRVRRQREFIGLLELRGQPAVFENRLRQWLLEWEEGRAAEYERRYKQWFEMRVDMIVALDRMLTPQQRAHAAERLQRYANDFRILSDRPAMRTAGR